MMRRIRLDLSYEGTHFHGFQQQEGNLRTVQEVLQESLTSLLQHPVTITGAGRTDAGVHALQQVVHFETSSTIPADRLPFALQRLLPDDLIVWRGMDVPPSFHARFTPHCKRYRYTIMRGSFPHLIWRHYALLARQPLQVEAMRVAASSLVGSHDFTTFCSARAQVEDKVRTIHSIQITEEGPLLHFDITGNGFLYNMVRIIVGTLLEVGQGKRSSEEMAKILAAQDRQLAGETAPPQGLVLYSITYENERKTTGPRDFSIDSLP